MQLPQAPDAYDRTNEQQARGRIVTSDLENFKKGQDVQLQRGERLIVKSASGTLWTLTVDNAGGLGASARGVYGAVSTTDATVTTIATVAIPTNTAVLIDVMAVARRTGGAAGVAGDSAGYQLSGIVKDIAGTVTIVAQTIVFQGEDQAGWNIALVVSGTNILVRVTGAVNNNINWVASGQYRSAA